jgi:hypothetical protein
MRRTSKVKIVGRLAEVLVLLVVISPSCSGQASNSPKPLNENQISSFTACYELVLGKWWPWSFAEDTVFVTHPLALNSYQTLAQKDLRRTVF